MSGDSLIAAEFARSRNVIGCCTQRQGGVSSGPYKSLNLASHVGDDSACVEENRRRAMKKAGLPSRPLWLDQCHGSQVAVLDGAAPARPIPRTDAAVTRVAGRVLAVLTADCLPVLLCSGGEGVIAVAHAGWRGLAAGVLENTLAAMRVPPGHVEAWLGPAIGASAFEVGEEVRAAFLDRDPSLASCFEGAGKRKWLADLAGLARGKLARAGVTGIGGGAWCTYSDSTRFYSYRRDGECGRMASFLWLDPSV